MNPIRRQALNASVSVAFSLLALTHKADAQAGGKVYLNPELGLGITMGHDHHKALGLDFGNLNRNVRLELKGGYWLTERVALFTGFGYSSYLYRSVAESIINGPDTVRSQRQEFWEVPLGVRVSSYYGDHSVRTRYYGAAGIRMCFLSDARHSYSTSDKVASESNVVRPEDFNSFWVRMFIEGGLDIPMDYGSAIVIGLNVSTGLSRNANTSGALMKNNFGVPVIGGNIGVRIGLTPEKPRPRRRR